MRSEYKQYALLKRTDIRLDDSGYTFLWLHPFTCTFAGFIGDGMVNDEHTNGEFGNAEQGFMRYSRRVSPSLEMGAVACNPPLPVREDVCTTEIGSTSSLSYGVSGVNK